MSTNSFSSAGRLDIGERTYAVHRLAALEGAADGIDIERLPYSIKVLLENLLRHEDGVRVTAEDILAVARFATTGAADREISFSPARILLQDFTGVPCIVDLAALRETVAALGGEPTRVNPSIPVDLVIDHSVIAEVAGRREAFSLNAALELQRNAERYRFLRWGQQAFSGLRVVPPDTGICHQVNLEYLSQVVFSDAQGNAYPDSVVGTDSHTPMVNGLSVVAWGVGGIEAEAAMLGQPIPLLVPRVVGLRLDGSLPEGATATDLVLTIAELLRHHGVVEKFVEVYGPGVKSVPVENRATIGNMSPEYGSTVTIFPIDAATLAYLSMSGRSEEQVRLVEAYAKDQGLFHDDTVTPTFSEHLELDLSSVVPSIAGPARPEDRVPLTEAKARYRAALSSSVLNREPDGARAPVPAVLGDGTTVELKDGAVVIAAITSCTNTSNPSVMLAAGLLARRAVELGCSTKPWVKASLAPGSRVVMDYYERSGLLSYLEKLGFYLVGFGCTTCIGNSGPLEAPISEAIGAGGLACVSVLSGNRNFEGRVHPEVRMNYLASPPLVVAYALAGTMDIDLYHEPLTTDGDGAPIYLRDLWPSSEEIATVVRSAVQSEMFAGDYADVFTGDEHWRAIEVPAGDSYAWDPDSSYIRRAPFVEAMATEPAPLEDLHGARVLALLGDSVTTDHISPAGSIRPDSPAGRFLADQGVPSTDFNSYGARRGNHEVMVRGTFANVRIRNQLAPGTEGGLTAHLPDGALGSIYDAAMAYRSEQVPLIVVAGKNYGSGSSRDWAAKGPALLGVRAVLAESYERIHRSNLIGMGVLPLQFLPGESAASIGLTGREIYAVTGIEGRPASELIRAECAVMADERRFSMLVRIDTPTEAEYFVNGGILPYVVRRLLRG